MVLREMNIFRVCKNIKNETNTLVNKWISFSPQRADCFSEGTWVKGKQTKVTKAVTSLNMAEKTYQVFPWLINVIP